MSNPTELSAGQVDYFATLAKIDPSPEMARIIERAKRDLLARPVVEGDNQ